MADSGTLTRADLAEIVHENIGLSRAACAEIVEDLLGHLCGALDRGENVKVSGFGTFVFQGIGQTAIDLVLLGAIPTVVLSFAAAVILDAIIDLTQRGAHDRD